MRPTLPVLLATASLLAACGRAPAPALASAVSDAPATSQAADRFATLQQLVANNDPAAEATLDREIGQAAGSPAAGPVSLAVWSEFLPFAQVAKQLPTLKAHGAMLFVAVKPEDLTSPDLFALWRAAHDQGVPIRPWLLLTVADGYWANKWNADAVRRHVERFLDGLTAAGLSTDWVTLDVEPPATLTTALGEHLKRFDLAGARSALAASSRSGSLSAARATYTALAGELHGRGVKLHAVTSSSVLDEPEPGRYRMQSALGTPVEGVPWDEVTFMAYRPEFEHLVGKLGPDLVYRYAAAAHALYGAKAGMDVGEVGSPGYPAPVPGYTDPAELTADLAAVQAAGISRADVYSLDGILQQGQADRWLAVPPAAKPAGNLKAALLRCFFQIMARTLPPGT